MQNNLSNMSDEQLVNEIKKLVSDEFRSLAELLSRLSEMDDRRLYAKLGYSSLFVYMVEVLHLSEDATYKRIQAARAAKRYPVILNLISEGKLNLTAINILTPILTDQNHEDVLEKAAFKSNREVERMRAEYAPRPDVTDLMRALPNTTCAGASCLKNNFNEESCGNESRIDREEMPEITSHARRDAIKPLSEQRVKFQFTGSEKLRSKIERAKQLLRHKHPHGRLEDIIEDALDALLEKKDPEKRIERKSRCHSELKAKNPEVPSGSFAALRMTANGHSRYIPQHIKDAVWKRDHGECQYLSPGGRRCDEKGGLEFDHVKPWAKGGASNDPENIRLLCHAHNQLVMRSEFGEHKRYP